MSLPEELLKPIDEIKTPSNRILVICLILTVISLSSVIVYLSNSSNKGLKNENENLRKQAIDCWTENRRLRLEKQEHDESEIRRLQERAHYFDSVLTLIKTIKNK